MKLHAFRPNQFLTDNIRAVQDTSLVTKTHNRKWYHWERVYLIKAADSEQYGFVKINFFEWLFKSCTFKKVEKAFKGQKITIIDGRLKKICNLSSLIHPSLRVRSLKLDHIPAQLQNLKENNNFAFKRIAFETYYTQLLNVETKEGLGHDRFLLYSLLEAYASQILYAQTINGDSEAGFRRSALLMKFSLFDQCGYPDPVNWTQFKTLEELTNDQKGFDISKLYNSPLKLNRIDRNALKDTLVRLAYSFQNIAELNQPTKENIELHTKLNSIIEPLLQHDTKAYAEFVYNRRPFVTALEHPDDPQEKIKSYDLLLNLLKDLPPFEYKRYLAKIHNMKGIILTRAKIEPEKALDYFTKAYELNCELIKEAPAKELDTQKFLKANVESSLVDALCKQGRRDDAAVHVASLKEYLKELDQQGNNHTYRAGYEKAIKIYEDAL